MSLRKELIEVCHKAYQNKFVSAYDGNLSARIDSSKILITPSAKCKGSLKEDDLIVIDYDGNLIEGNAKVSTEAKIHLFAYKSRPEVQSVVHCHPVYASAFSITNNILDQPIFPEVILSLGRINICPYATPSTPEVPNSMKSFIAHSWVLLLQNHGAISFGKSIEEAYFKMEKLEHFAKIMSVANQLGKINKLNEVQLKKLYEISDQVYGIKLSNKEKF
ncbi:MAG: class II aldolase/adducin family protein [Bacteroidetes bacterium]|nr:class II aldolase/adducin family protein [Bacteroidota bacterium]